MKREFKDIEDLALGVLHVEGRKVPVTIEQIRDVLRVLSDIIGRSNSAAHHWCNYVDRKKRSRLRRRPFYRKPYIDLLDEVKTDADIPNGQQNNK